MVIISIKFKSGSKTYDYLMSNPEHNKLDRTKPIQLVSGCDHGRLIYNIATLVDCRKIDSLPSYVTTYLVVGKDNIVSSNPIAKDMLVKLQSIAAVTPTPKFKWPQHPVDHSYLDAAMQRLSLDPIARLQAIYHNKY